MKTKKETIKKGMYVISRYGVTCGKVGRVIDFDGGWSTVFFEGWRGGHHCEHHSFFIENKDRIESGYFIPIECLEPTNLRKERIYEN